MVSFPGPQTALIMPFESERAACYSRGDIRAEEWGLHWIELGEKELAKELVTCNCKVRGLPLMLGFD
jgi:hypothetical protein